MPSLSNNRLAILLALALARGTAFAAEADERVLWNLWTVQKSSPSNHAAVVAACRDAESKLGGSPLLPVCRGLMAWHLLESGDLAAAEKAWTSTLSPSGVTPLELACDDVAKRWLTRLDRERVRRGLDGVYRKRVEYPETLAALAGSGAPLTDRWGKPWKYRLAEFKHFKGLAGQTYVLECERLGESSDLAVALRQPYPDSLDLAPDRLVDTKTVQFHTLGEKPETLVMVEGSGAKNATLALVGTRILVLNDGDRWFLLGKPGG